MLSTLLAMISAEDEDARNRMSVLCGSIGFIALGLGVLGLVIRSAVRSAVRRRDDDR